MVRFRGYKEDPEIAVFDVRWLRRLWPFARPYRAGFAACMLLLVASFGIELLKPYLMRLTLDGPVKSALKHDAVDTTMLWQLGAAYLAALIAGAGLGYGYGLLAARNGQRVIRDVRSHLQAHLLALSPRFFDRNPAGKLVTRVTSDVENLNEMISTGVLHALFDVFKIVGLMIALFVLEPGLALFTLGCAPVIFFCSLMFRGLFRRSFRAVRGRLARQNAFTAEAIGGVRVTRVFGQESAVQSHYAELNADTRASWLRTIGAFALFTSVVDLAIVGSQAGMLWLGGGKLIAGTLSVGALWQFWSYFSTLTGPIKDIGEKYNVLQSAFASSERIFGILDEPPFPPPRADAKPSTRGAAAIHFDHVSFRYVASKPVLQDVSFDVRPGQRVALVGPTGAGKSTVLALLSRLMDPDSGRVLLDGVDLRELEVESLRRRIAVVPQDVFLFTGSVLDNVRLFDDSIPETRVAAALEAVGAWEFVQRLDGGLHAKVEERGATFSQGERQLLSFARALAADPDVLVLDEATASVDSETEARIQKALQTVLRGRTSLVVAHRLSTVRDADRILVLQKGRLVEAGTHRELVEQAGVYARMVKQVASV